MNEFKGCKESSTRKGGYTATTMFAFLKKKSGRVMLECRVQLLDGKSYG